MLETKSIFELSEMINNGNFRCFTLEDGNGNLYESIPIFHIYTEKNMRRFRKISQIGVADEK